MYDTPRAALTRIRAKSDGPPVTELLTLAVSQLKPPPGRQPWNHGWCLPDYRRSAEAALAGPDGPVTFSADGLDAWEQAATRLLHEKQIQDRWYVCAHDHIRHQMNTDRLSSARALTESRPAKHLRGQAGGRLVVTDFRTARTQPVTPPELQYRPGYCRPGARMQHSTFAVMRRRGPRLAGLPGFLRLWLVGGMWGEIGLR